MTSNREWIHKATCANPQYDPSWWDVDGHTLSDDNRLAMLLCTTVCPVFEQCWGETQANPARYQGTIRHGERVSTPAALRKRQERAERGTVSAASA